MRALSVALLLGLGGCLADIPAPDPDTYAQLVVAEATEDTETIASPDEPLSNIEECGERPEDTSWLGASCSPVDSPCPHGFTCRPRADIVVTLGCEILCENDCDCPEGLVCHWVPDPFRPFRACE